MVRDKPAKAPVWNEQDRQPHFLIIGAAKSGSTWLVSCLRKHPELFIPLNEIHYWTRHTRRIEPSHQWYGRWFRDAGNEQVRGENSNTYLFDPEAAGRIAKWLPNARLVAILRNPIDRAYSGYCMRYRYGDVSSDVALYLDPDRTPTPSILENGLYFRALSRYLQKFPHGQLHVIIHDDIAKQPEQLLDDVCRFLGVAPCGSTIYVADSVNTKGRNWPLPRFHRLYSRFALVRQLNDALRGSVIHRKILQAVTRPVSYPPFPQELRSRLAQYYARDVEQLSVLVDRDLSGWLSAAPEPAGDSVLSSHLEQH